jgi:acyl-CoA dehydrogenase
LAEHVAYDCVQLHRGYGCMRGYPIEGSSRDIRLMTVGGGISEIMSESIGQQMGL